MRGYLLLFFLAATLYTEAQVYPYYPVPTITRLRFQLSNGTELPDTNSSHLNHPAYSPGDIFQFQTFPEDRPLMADLINAFSEDISNRLVKKADLIKDLGMPSQRSLTPAGDSAWFFKKILLYIYFKEKDSTAIALRSVNYYQHINIEFDSSKKEMKYTPPYQKHLNVTKEWKNGHYTFRLNIDITNPRFRKENSGKGLVLLFKNGERIDLPEQAVIYQRLDNVSDIDRYLTTTLILKDEEVKKIIRSTVYSIKLVNEWENIPYGEAEDLQQYMRLLDKIR